MIVFLALSLLFNGLVLIFDSRLNQKYRCIENLEENEYLFYLDKPSTVMFELFHLFLILAIIINLRNWTFYFLKIGEMAYYQN